MRIAVILGLLLIGASTADACQRCGLFGNRCRYVAPVVKQAVVQQYAAPVAYQAPAAVVAAPQYSYQPPPIYVTNVYPDANGAAGLLAKQGNSIYGFQQAAAAYFANPAEVLRQAAELSRAATQTAALGLSGYNQTAQTQLTLQASIAEPLAKGQAAAEVLTAAGLTQSVARGESIALRLSAGVAVNEHTTPSQSLPPPISLLAEKCGRCHGLSLSEPKGGVYVDPGHKLDRATLGDAMRAVATGNMPKEGQLTDHEKLKIFEELSKLQKEGDQ